VLFTHMKTSATICGHAITAVATVVLEFGLE
jgi:hypothetical protein